jgi:hypothetical protein
VVKNKWRLLGFLGMKKANNKVLQFAAVPLLSVASSEYGNKSECLFELTIETVL